MIASEGKCQIDQRHHLSCHHLSCHPSIHFLSVRREINLEPLQIEVEEGGGDEGLQARDALRDSTQYRSIVLSRLGGTVKKATEIDLYQKDKFKEILKKLKNLSDQVRVLAMSPAARLRDGAVTTRRGEIICVGDPNQGQELQYHFYLLNLQHQQIS